MGKRFRTDHLNQGLLLPPALHDWLPEGHLARFIADVTEELDLGSVYRSYEGDGRGMAAYQLAWFDAHLWAYAECLGLPEILSEDFQEGRMYGKVRIVNPFRSS